MRFKTCINYLLTASQHEVFGLLSDRLSQYGVTPGQYGVLSYLWEKEQANPKDLARELSLENSTISGVLDRMQKKGLIDRLLDPDDRRSIQVVLTPAGRALEADVLRAVDEVNEEVLSRFDPETAETLIRCLQKIADTRAPEREEEELPKN
ncbi:MarR family winged helix-turn-helix transcriptional regulator [Papillibacter cinnamivorans]|uniref:DNA-binding transcriptional regulator, MarR family n=1 Tax=Papillibacter cinnamivorans DSM 12816 TaxID=1122930 RepID=A0A1W1ZIQ7_9FIRM|nr:MarR family transcriptional regulator [Papillibacter cinnamivorans]SMC48399.1 DNA-binding transcriptional regulator, MarR family [Papillibacter cinnamivorans DSM 12816]